MKKVEIRRLVILTIIFMLCSRIFNLVFVLLFGETPLGIYITNDALHHYHYGIVLMIGSLLFRKRLRQYFIYILSFGLGLFLDEYTQLFSDIHVPWFFIHLSLPDTVTIFLVAFMILLVLKPNIRDVTG